MNKTNKIILLFYIFLIISYTSFIIYTDYEIKDTIYVTDEIKLVKTVPLNKTKIFETMTELENYPLVLPKNILSVKILNQSNNIVYAEEEFTDKLIKIKFLAKHTILPYDAHIIEILDGDAKGTIISQKFEGNEHKTTLTTKIKLQFNGELEQYNHLPRYSVVEKIADVIQSFISYSTIDTTNKKIIDDMYREILKRPADVEGYEYWGSLLESNKITIEEMRQEFYDSKEYDHLLNFEQKKSLDNLKEDTKKIIDDMYREILKRPADVEGYEYWGSLLESNKITIEEMRQEFYDSKEYNTYIKNKSEN